MIIVKLVAAVLFTHWMSQGSKATEKNDGICISHANVKFVSLARNIFTSDMFYTEINNLKCLYVSIYRNKTFVLLLHGNFSTLLNFKMYILRIIMSYSLLLPTSSHNFSTNFDFSIQNVVFSNSVSIESNSS